MTCMFRRNNNCIIYSISWDAYEKARDEKPESSLRQRATCRAALTSKSHGNARSPTLVPKNQTNVRVWGPPRSHARTHSHTRAPNTSLALDRAIDNSLPRLSFIALLWVPSLFSAPNPWLALLFLVITLLIKHLFEERWHILLFVGAGWWHASSETVTRTPDHRGLRLWDVF